MKRLQQGFTLIELVVVLVLLGILGAAATARYQDLSAAAEAAAVSGIAAELSSASAINFAAGSVPGGAPDVDLIVDTTCNATGGTDDVEDLFQSGNLPAGFTFAGAVDCAAAAAGDTFTCVVSRGAATANATIICTG